MKINGELKTFTTGGREISIIWGTGQYDLSLLFYGSTQGTLRLEMIYKETGNNVIDLLKLGNFDEAHTGMYELVNDDFESNVLVNRSECFYATFSGKINANGEELIITEGVISYEYDEPFDE
ncbi:hypothetical protein KJK34_08925 [Flavobacterium sp. D11R37]|uniref:hypothetical protein n=1 Tax=Flavobacterium coralii TaxID=2838017 RepID=UPI001CA63C83|nr:hypothetical protein [Flavobacterium coralii]MBY8962870.1 hypothetical protein [Flavobacterium coralii]